MKSLLYQAGATPFVEPPGCGINPCRQEVAVNVYKNGRHYKFVLRDKVLPEDPYLVMIKAIAFAVRESEPYVGQAPPRSIRDFLVKNNVVI